MERSEAATPISAGRLRLGLLCFALWWLPVYLTVPAITAALGDGGNAHAVKRITLTILSIQTVIGVAGLLLLGKQLALTLKHVPIKKLPHTVWKIAWNGKSDLP